MNRNVPSTSFKRKRKLDGFTTDEMSKQATVSKVNKAEAKNHEVMGNNLVIAGHYAQALEEYNRAIELNPHKAVYYYRRAVAHSILDHQDLCIRDFEHAVEQDPNLGEVYGSLAIQYNKLGMLRKAKATFIEALFFEPGNDLYETYLVEIEGKLQAEQTQGGEKPASPVYPSTSSIYECRGTQYGPDMVKATKQLLRDPGACNIVAAMIETNIVEQNSVGELFLHIRKDFNPNSCHEVYKYPLEHTLEEYPPEIETRRT